MPDAHTRAEHSAVDPAGQEWRNFALTLRRQGVTYRDIGVTMGISRERARQLGIYAEHEERQSAPQTPAEYWGVVTECLAKDWVVTLGQNPECPEGFCDVTLHNWRTGGLWATFKPTWGEALGAALEWVRQD